MDEQENDIMQEQQNNSSSISTFYWEKCIMCQQTTGEPLQCPADMKRSDVDPGVGYHPVASKI